MTSIALNTQSAPIDIVEEPLPSLVNVVTSATQIAENFQIPSNPRNSPYRPRTHAVRTTYPPMTQSLQKSSFWKRASHEPTTSQLLQQFGKFPQVLGAAVANIPDPLAHKRQETTEIIGVHRKLGS